MTKLLALARIFGVTTDELLSETEPNQSGPETGMVFRPEPVRTDPSGKESAGPPEEPDRLPGFLGRLIRKYGWLAGAYVALSGLGFAIVGALARFLFGQMFRISNDMFNSIGGFGDMGGVIIEGTEDLPPEVMNQILGELGGGVSGLGGMSAVSDMGRLFQGFAMMILLIGVVILLAGIILAVWLYRRGRTENEKF